MNRAKVATAFAFVSLVAPKAHGASFGDWTVRHSTGGNCSLSTRAALDEETYGDLGFFSSIEVGFIGTSLSGRPLELSDGSILGPGERLFMLVQHIDLNLIPTREQVPVRVLDFLLDGEAISEIFVKWIYLYPWRVLQKRRSDAVFESLAAGNSHEVRAKIAGEPLAETVVIGELPELHRDVANRFEQCLREVD